VRLYRNTGSAFIEITRQAGLESRTTAVDCSVADYDHDGKQDLFVLYWKQNAALYHNDGGAKFSDSTEGAGLAGIHGTSFSALLFDYDDDGWPDLLISTQAAFEESVRSLLQPSFAATRETPRLFRNQKNGRFAEVTRTMGLDRSYGTMQVIAADLDSDGWTDLVLVNGSLDAERLEPSVALHNEQGKGFKEWFCFSDFDTPSNLAGAAIGGINKDGEIDFYVASNPLLPGIAPSGLFEVRVPEGLLQSGSRH
jgi:VCBS repeat protein